MEPLIRDETLDWHWDIDYLPRPRRRTHAPAAPVADIARAILVLHRQRVILDADLAALYGVTTKRLNEQVKRNAARFPEDFMFRLSPQETDALNRSQIATGSQKHRDPRFQPFAFTEHGAIMAATVLSSPRAVEMSLYVVRAFIRLRELLAANSAPDRVTLHISPDGRIVASEVVVVAMLSVVFKDASRDCTHPTSP